MLHVMADEEWVLVALDGGSHDVAMPLLHVDDFALRGDGTFETVLVRNGEPCKIELHLSRLRRNADLLELPELDLTEWRAAIDQAVRRWGVDREGEMRLVLTRGRQSPLGTPVAGSTGYVTVCPVPERTLVIRRDGVSVVTLQRDHSIELGRDMPWLLLGVKTLSYATNSATKRFARRMGADDAIFVSNEGEVLEGTTSTVVVARDGTLLTPPHSHGIVPGTTQNALFEVAEKAGFECRYAPLSVTDLLSADGLWLVSSVALAVRVHTLDGVALSCPEIGPQIAALVDAGIRHVGDLVR